MNEYDDALYHRRGSDVLHRVRIYWDQIRIRTACGLKVDFSDPGVIEEGEFSEKFIDWLWDRGRKVYALCSHCGDREFEE